MKRQQSSPRQVTPVRNWPERDSVSYPHQVTSNPTTLKPNDLQVQPRRFTQAAHARQPL